jgi:hypothetical protein|tara:strand:+ start:422 stop:565 length:144 start_codon:yes stop_codon:yes gene_type:complete
MAKKFKELVIREPIHKKTSQGTRKGVKTSSMNKNKRRSLKFYNRQGR